MNLGMAMPILNVLKYLSRASTEGSILSVIHNYIFIIHKEKICTTNIRIILGRDRHGESTYLQTSRVYI